MRKCVTCGKVLTGRQRKYCSPACHPKNYCARCGKEISLDATYCRSCAQKKEGEIRHCELCGDELKEHQDRFCSVACLGASRVPIIPKGEEPPESPDWTAWVYGGSPRPKVEFIEPVTEIVWQRALAGKKRPEKPCMDCGQEVPPGYITRCAKCAEEAVWECKIGTCDYQEKGGEIKNE